MLLRYPLATSMLLCFGAGLRADSERADIAWKYVVPAAVESREHPRPVPLGPSSLRLAADGFGEQFLTRASETDALQLAPVDSAAGRVTTPDCHPDVAAHLAAPLLTSTKVVARR